MEVVKPDVPDRPSLSPQRWRWSKYRIRHKTQECTYGRCSLDTLGSGGTADAHDIVHRLAEPARGTAVPRLSDIASMERRASRRLLGSLPGVYGNYHPCPTSAGVERARHAWGSLVCRDAVEFCGEYPGAGFFWSGDCLLC